MGRKKFSSRRKIRKNAFYKSRWFLVLTGMFAIGCLVLLIGYELVSKPYKDRAAGYDLNKIDEVELPSMIYDRKQREVGRIFVENRSPIGIAEIPQKMIDALVAGEDSRFWTHDGVDYIGIGRAIKGNLESGNEDSGASTLTQQLARNAFHLQEEARERGENTYERKMVEIYLAHRIEDRYSKAEILEFYLNRVAFGSGYFGIRSASLGYFGKEPRNLDTEECASLVGCIKNPSVFSPMRSKKNNRRARNHVLNRMAIEGMITTAEKNRLQALPVELNPKPIQRGTSHFYDRVAEMLKEQLKPEELARGGFKVFTTIDLDVQQALDRKLKEQLAKAEAREGYKHPKYEDFRMKEGSAPEYLQGAALMLDNKTGEILGYVGGRDFTHSQYDFIEAGRKPLGTAFFPYIYTAALEEGMNPASKVLDEAMDNRQVAIDGVEGILGEWGNEVLDPRYEGEISLRRSLSASKIAATVRLGRKIGLGRVKQMAQRMGLEFGDEKLLTKTFLGTNAFSLTEVVKSYCAFPNGGEAPTQLTWVTSIEDPEGEVVYSKRAKRSGEKVLHPATAFLMQSMMRSVLTTGSGSTVADDLGLGDMEVGGKTGTTSDFADNWFIGFNDRVTCGVWAGFWDGSREAIYRGAFSKDTVLPVWAAGMKALDDEMRLAKVERPEDVELVKICSVSGMKVTRDCEEYIHDVVSGRHRTISTAVNEYFYVKNRPMGYCNQHGSGIYDVDPNAFAINRGVSVEDVLTVIPVKPIAPTLLGDDPYDSEQPSFVPVDVTAKKESRGLGAVNLDQLSSEDKEATIHLRRPGRISILD